MAGPPVDATMHRRAAASAECSETGRARRNDPILVTEPQLDPIPAELAYQTVQSRRGVGNAAILPDLAADAVLGHRHCDPRLMNIKTDINDTIPHDPSPYA
jgi:hypothetical protein